MSSSRATIIFNGKAAGNDAIREAITTRRRAGHEIQVRVTWEAGDAQRFVKELSEDCGLFIAAGGDGTVNELVHALMRVPAAQRPALGILPQGTANDLATACGIPADPGEALTLCLEHEPALVDVGRANDRWFLNAASAGFAAAVTAGTPPELKRILGGAAYTLMGALLAMNFTPTEERLVLPDRELTHVGRALVVGNGRLAGGGQQTTPRALLDDGLLDLLVVHQIPLTEMLNAARELKELTPDGQFVAYFRAPWIEVHAAAPFPVNLDGEPTEFSSVRYEVEPLALRLHLPAGCPLLSANAASKRRQSKRPRRSNITPPPVRSRPQDRSIRSN